MNNPMQVRDLVRNLAAANASDPQLLLRIYMMQRFIERISVSRHRSSLVLKGGMLVSSIVGCDKRTTMDIDATMMNESIEIPNVESIINEIARIQLDDGIVFAVGHGSTIMSEAEHPGVRLKIVALLGKMRIPFAIDVSKGDAITPGPVEHNLSLMLEDRQIKVVSYNLETILAEKLETAISRSLENTRMRDFYDIHILMGLCGEDLDIPTLAKALAATMEKRGSTDVTGQWKPILKQLEDNPSMNRKWNAYQKKYPYAAGIEWKDVCSSVESVLERIEKPQERHSPARDGNGR